MSSEVIVVHPGQQPPKSWHACVFIADAAPGAGPSAKRWQDEMIRAFRAGWMTEGRLVLLVPEPNGLVSDNEDDGLIGWYDRALSVADVVVFWWPDDASPRFVPVAVAAWNDSQRVVYGVPPDAAHVHDLLNYARQHSVSMATTLPGMVSAVLRKVGSGAHRTAGEREVPLPVWRTDSFQRWYSAQTSAGNTFGGGAADVDVQYRAAPSASVLLGATRADLCAV